LPPRSCTHFRTHIHNPHTQHTHTQQNTTHTHTHLFSHLHCRRV
jgi:hypothetical protein